MQPEIDFLGYHIDADGRHLMNEKIRAIEEAPIPINMCLSCILFLGSSTIIARFLPTFQQP